VIDARVHHWVLERFRYPWLDDAAFEALRADYLPADYRADAAGMPVDGWVHVPGPGGRGARDVCAARGGIEPATSRSSGWPAISPAGTSWRDGSIGCRWLRSRRR